jgi:alginate O-acetyltransferase complex protein AlgI
MHKSWSEFVHQFASSEFYVSLPFWAAVAIVVVLYRLTARMGGFRDCLLLVCSVCLLLTLPRFDLTMLGVLLAVCGATYAIAGVLLNSARLTQPKSRQFLVAAGISLNVLVLAFFKYRFFQDFILDRSTPALRGSDFVFLIGISYTAFRAMHFVIEAYKRSIQNPTFLSFLNYMLFFPSFISGPIHRYNHFCANSAAGRNSSFSSDFKAGLLRVVQGLFKKTVLTVLIFPYTLKNVQVPVHEMSFWQIALGLYAFALYLYLDFSGYTDLAIGTGRLMGFVLPENFNRPFLKPNIQQLWANFHISLTSWLTDYVYWPLSKKLRTFDYFRKNPILLSNCAIIVTFVVCGIWHGDTAIFLLWGLYHGIGLSVLNVYQKWKRKMRNPVMRKYFTSKLSYAVGVVGTFTFYSVGLSAFILSTAEMKLLVSQLASDLVMAFATLI